MSPTALISYRQWDGGQDIRPRATALADRLRGDGVDAMVDTYLKVPPPSWPQWMHHQLSANEFVVVLCTADYKRAAEVGVSGGATWEAMILTQAIYEDAEQAGAKIVPVTLDGDRAVVPYFLRGTTAFDLSVDDDYLGLLRVLFKVPEIDRPPLGEPPPEISQALGGSRWAARGEATLAATAGSRWNTHRELVVIGAAGAVQHTWSKSDDEAFVEWRSLPPFPDPPPRAAASSSFAHAGGSIVPLDIYALSMTGSVWATGVPAGDGRWVDWYRVAQHPGVTSLASSSLWAGHSEIFLLAPDGLRHTWRQGIDGPWSDLTDMPLPPGGPWTEVAAAPEPSPIVGGAGAQVLVLVSPEGEVAVRRCGPGGEWTDWRSLQDGPLQAEVVDAAVVGRRLIIAGRRSDELLLAGWDLDSETRVSARPFPCASGDWFPKLSTGVRTAGPEVFCIARDSRSRFTIDQDLTQIVRRPITFGSDGPR